MATSPQPADPPLSIEAVTGWRIWRLVREDGVLALASVTRPDTWPRDRVMLATCDIHLGKTVPDFGCTCGLYAAATPEYLAASGMFSPASCVVGAIAMWGTVVEHAQGARSRLAYPARLRLVCGACLSAGAGAIAPKTVVDSDGVLTAVCTKHRKGITGPSWPADQVQSELLSTYGVDLMPIERIAKSLRTGSVVTRATPPEPVKVVALAIWSIVKMLATGLFMLWACSGLILLALAIVFAAFHAVTVAIGLAPATAAATPVVTAPPPSTSIVAWSPHVPAASIVIDFPDRGVHPALVTLPPFAVVCGMGSGVRIDVVSCKVDGADLLGWAERSPPHGPKEDCVGRWDAYAHGRRFWICWNDFLETSDIERWVHSPNPWSIPVDEGGAIHEHR